MTSHMHQHTADDPDCHDTACGRPARTHQIHPDPAVRQLIAQAEQRGAEAERDRWVERLSPLCDDEWLRRRDRAMELPGAKGHRWERRAASAWEQAANGVRSTLNDLADYEELYVNRHEAYVRWLKSGRDEAPEPRVLRVHNHPPYDPVCSERRVDGHLRGACLNDDGTNR